MVGLSVVLEAQKTLQKRPQILSKITMIRPSPSGTGGGAAAGFFPSTSLPPISFLDSCFLCSKRLCPGNDIYMYKGDRAFCSVECRCRQIFMDEENLMNENCSAAAASPPSASSSRRRKGNRNRGSGLFAY